ncbi:unnamed protein product, partial [Amoebophrya sp. A25]
RSSAKVGSSASLSGRNQTEQEEEEVVPEPRIASHDEDIEAANRVVLVEQEPSEESASNDNFAEQVSSAVPSSSVSSSSFASAFAYGSSSSAGTGSSGAPGSYEYASSSTSGTGSEYTYGASSSSSGATGAVSAAAPRTVLKKATAPVAVDVKKLKASSKEPVAAPSQTPVDLPRSES